MKHLPEINLLKVITEEKENTGKFIIEPLLPGYGHTIGNSLRRVLLSSLPGAAITSIKINNQPHEFTTVDGVHEDLIDIILNLKTVRIKMDSDDPAKIELNVKGDRDVTAADFKTSSSVKIINKDQYIAHVNKGKSLNIEAIVEKGKGYLPSEKMDQESLPVGMIAIDASFSPIKKINYNVENTRIGRVTNYDKIIFEVETDGTVSPSEAMKSASEIIIKHFTLISDQINTSQNSKKKVEKKKKNAK